MPRLLTNAQADGPGEAVRVRPDAGFAQFGTPITGTVYVTGTLNGGTVALEARGAAGDDWVAVPGSALTATGLGNLGIWCHEIRAVLTGAGAATNVTVTLVTPERSEVL